MLLETLAIDRIGFEGIDSAGRSSPFGGQKREVAEISADIDEPGVGFEQSVDQAGGVQLIEADGHGDVGIGAKIEVEAQAVRGLENSLLLRLRHESAGEAGEAIAATLGG